MYLLLVRLFRLVGVFDRMRSCVGSLHRLFFFCCLLGNRPPRPPRPLQMVSSLSPDYFVERG